MRLTLDEVRGWRMSGHGKRASFSAWTVAAVGNRRAFASVRVRRKSGERLEDMMTRGLTELTRRLEHGMPVRQVMTLRQFERAMRG